MRGGHILSIVIIWNFSFANLETSKYFPLIRDSLCINAILNVEISIKKCPKKLLKLTELLPNPREKKPIEIGNFEVRHVCLLENTKLIKPRKQFICSSICSSKSYLALSQ